MESLPGRTAASAPARWWVRRRVFRSVVGSNRWDGHHIRAYQDARLGAIIHLAAARTPFCGRFYAERGVNAQRFRRAADLPMLPIVIQEDMRADGPEFCVGRVPRWGTRAYNMRGTTAGLVARIYGYRGLDGAEAGYVAALGRRVGARSTDRMAVLRGELGHEPGTLWEFDAGANRLILSSYQLTPERARGYIALMKQYRVQWLHAYPSAAWALATIIQEHDLRFDVPLRGVLFGSEMLLPRQYPVFRRVFGCPVYAHYGHREHALLAGWCERGTDYHFLPVYGYVEFRPVAVASSEGDTLHELIGTGFTNRYMPLIRYATGDYAEPALPGPCPECGRHHVRTRQIFGRGQNFLVAASGTIVPYTSLEIHSYNLTARYQFYQEEPGQVIFRFVPARRDGLPATIAQLQRDFAGLQRLGLTVRIEPVEDLPRTWSGKDIVVVQKCPLPWDKRTDAGNRAQSDARADGASAAPLDRRPT